MFDILIPGISDTIHFTSRVIEYCFQYFWLLSEIADILEKLTMGILASFIRDIRLFASKDI